MLVVQYVGAKKRIKEVARIFGSWVNTKVDSTPERELQSAAKAVMDFHKFGYYKLSRHATEYYKAAKRLTKAWRNCQMYWDNYWDWSFLKGVSFSDEQLRQFDA